MQRISTPELHLRPGGPADLEAVNAVIEAAVMGWDLTERVKRLSLASYRYDEHELDHLTLALAEALGNSMGAGVAGVAAWEPLGAGEGPTDGAVLLLHGIYVHPDSQHKGIGGHLFAACLDAAKTEGYDGVLVRANPQATGFFDKLGLAELAVEDPERDYPHRYWMAV